MIYRTCHRNQSATSVRQFQYHWYMNSHEFRYCVIRQIRGDMPEPTYIFELQNRSWCCTVLYRRQICGDMPHSHRNQSATNLWQFRYHWYMKPNVLTICIGWGLSHEHMKMEMLVVVLMRHPGSWKSFGVSTAPAQGTVSGQSYCPAWPTTHRHITHLPENY